MMNSTGLAATITPQIVASARGPPTPDNLQNNESADDVRDAGNRAKYERKAQSDVLGGSEGDEVVAD